MRRLRLNLNAYIMQSASTVLIQRSNTMRKLLTAIALTIIVTGCTAVPADHVPVWDQPVNHGD